MRSEQNLEAEKMVEALLKAGVALSWFAGEKPPESTIFYMDSEGIIYSVMLGETKHTVESLTQNLLIYGRLDHIQELYDRLTDNDNL